MPDYCDRFIGNFEEEYFTPEIGTIIRGVKRVYMAYKTAPSITQLVDTIIPNICKNDEDKIEAAVDALQEAEFADLPTETDGFYDWVVDETKTFIKRKRLEHALIKCVDLMESNNIEEAISVVMEANNIIFDESLGLKVEWIICQLQAKL